MKVQTKTVTEEQNRDQRENFMSKLSFFPARVIKIDTIHPGIYHLVSERKTSFIFDAEEHF